MIRRATVADAAPLAELVERTFRLTFAEGTKASDLDLFCAASFSEDIQRREITDPGWVTFVAEEEGTLAGFAQLRLQSTEDCVSAETPVELHRLYVDPAWHGRGLAHDLMRAAWEVAVDAGADQFWLGVWEHNFRAQAFYRKFGFEVVGDHVFPVGEDPQRDLVMAVAIDGRPGV
ncbi:GNAT family N-acetyltransferase [Elongatibacter sediminis]|uniref:GNAT family N-acetyltransferase n=1 Tax=Elongatibacter sediminis TaxID=3119006 RepID=A0AAW9RLZ6_9GAMM